jgi:hypothetical protein
MKQQESLLKGLFLHTRYYCFLVKETKVFFYFTAVRSSKKSKGLLQSVGVTRQNHLSPKAKFFYKRTKSLQQVAAKLRSKGMSVNRKLNYLAKKEGVLRYLKDVNEITADFFFVPITNTKI